VKAAAVGHVEWIEFATVEHVPVRGEIVHATGGWDEAGGGGGVAAVQLAQLADTAYLFTCLGDDGLGRRARSELEARGVIVAASFADSPQRRAFTHVDASRERTITTVGPRLGPSGADASLPWEELGECDGVYFCAGDADALVQARRARVLVVSARELALLRSTGVEADVLVGSRTDAAERYVDGDLDPPPKVVVRTDGARGGEAEPGGSFAGGPTPAEVVDSYGPGDCFAAGLAFGLGAGLPLRDALGFAARCGAGALAGRGVHAERVELPAGAARR